MKAPENPLWFRDPRSNSECFILISLEAGGPGIYTGTLPLPNLAGLDNICIVDDSSDLVWNGSAAAFVNGQRSLQYEVLDDIQQLCVAAKASTSVSVNASFTATGVSKATSSSAAVPSAGVYFPSLLGGVAVGIMWV